VGNLCSILLNNSGDKSLIIDASLVILNKLWIKMFKTEFILPTEKLQFTWKLLVFITASFVLFVAMSIQPYQFEPRGRGSRSQRRPQQPDEDPAKVSTEPARLLSTSWCICEKCMIMPTTEECTCCREIPQVQQKLTGKFRFTP